MKLPLSIFLLSIFCGHIVGFAQPSGSTEIHDIRDFVHQIYIHGMPYAEVVRFDPAVSVPTLLEMLSDTKEKEYWPNIVVALGMLGDERAVDTLITFLEQDAKGSVLTHAEYIAKSSVVMALGYVINKSRSEKALNYLKEHVKPQSWRDKIQWTSPYHSTPDALDIQLSKMTILGLGLSGNPSAAETLTSLRTDPDKEFRTQVRDVVAEAQKANEKIFKEGLASYYGSGQ
jgi:HEAT repeat protein